MTLLEKMLAALPFSAEELGQLISTAPYRYKVYKIPKRAEGQFRTIAQPTPEVKLIQRWLIKEVLCELPIHKAAIAYRRGKSIRDHAIQHAGRRFLLKMDFKDFFPSITASDVQTHLIEVGGLSQDEARVVRQLVSWRDKRNDRLCISIGAPSSPMVSNALLYEFDRRITELAKAQRVTYTRYADDLAFSTNQKGVLSEVLRQVEAVCRQLKYPQLTVNKKKTVSTSRAHRRVLTGLVLTPEGDTSLGREKKRRLRSEVYRFSLNRMPSDQVPKLRGELAFAWSVEKAFVLTLIRQYGSKVLHELGLPIPIENERQEDA